jgi:hypothetical protein
MPGHPARLRAGDPDLCRRQGARKFCVQKCETNPISCVLGPKTRVGKKTKPIGVAGGRDWRLGVRDTRYASRDTRQPRGRRAKQTQFRRSSAENGGAFEKQTQSGWPREAGSACGVWADGDGARFASLLRYADSSGKRRWETLCQKLVQIGAASDTARHGSEQAVITACDSET